MDDPVQSLYSIRSWLEQRPETAIIAAVWIVMTVLYCLLAVFQVGRKPGVSHGHTFIGFAANLVLGVGAFVAVIYLIPRNMLESAQATVRSYAERVQLVEPYPLRWKTGEGGAIEQIRFQGDRIEIETLNAAGARRAGEFSLAELRKRGNKYVGETERRSDCSWRDTSGEERHKECAEQLSIELTSVTPRRIEGRMQFYRPDSGFNCRQCSHSAPPAWRPFVWTPE